jgi:hypothetical protein
MPSESSRAVIGGISIRPGYWPSEILEATAALREIAIRAKEVLATSTPDTFLGLQHDAMLDRNE